MESAAFRLRPRRRFNRTPNPSFGKDAFRRLSIHPLGWEAAGVRSPAGGGGGAWRSVGATVTWFPARARDAEVPWGSIR